MRTHNQVILIGNCVGAPESVETHNGKKLLKFAIAIKRDWPITINGKEHDVDFHKIIAWGKLAEICAKFIEKGTKVFIDGKLVNNTYEINNEKRSVTEIHANEIEILSWKNQDKKTLEVNKIEKPEKLEEVTA